MKITAISDLHGFFPELPGGDLLIIAGDLTARDTKEEYDKFCNWTTRLDYRKIVVVGGNHDNFLQFTYKTEFTYWEGWGTYLCDSRTEFQGLKIWGSPWTAQFPGMNPHCCAFTKPQSESLKEYWDKIPDDTDILITHGPPFGILDGVGPYRLRAGDKDLLEASQNRIKPKIHVFGHIHEQGGQMLVFKRPGHGTENNTTYINASYVNEHYQPVNQPVHFEL